MNNSTMNVSALSANDIHEKMIFIKPVPGFPNHHNGDWVEAFERAVVVTRVDNNVVYFIDSAFEPQSSHMSQFLQVVQRDKTTLRLRKPEQNEKDRTMVASLFKTLARRIKAHDDEILPFKESQEILMNHLVS